MFHFQKIRTLIQVFPCFLCNFYQFVLLVYLVEYLSILLDKIMQQQVKQGKNAKRRQGILPALGMNNPPPQNRSGGNFNNIKLIWVLKCLATTKPQNPLSKAWNFWHVIYEVLDIHVFQIVHHVLNL